MKTKILIIIFTFLVISCVSEPLSYSYKEAVGKSQAINVIEQVLYEQPRKHRPEIVFISDNFLGLSDGKYVKSKGSSTAIQGGDNFVVGVGSVKTFSKDINQRIYFNSIPQPKLFKKGDWYIVQIVDVHGRPLRTVFTLEQIKAEMFIDSIMFLKTHGKEFGK